MRHLFVAILLLPAALLAQTPQRLTLAEAESLWQDHNRELQLARTAVSGAEADVLTAVIQLYKAMGGGWQSFATAEEKAS